MNNIKTVLIVGAAAAALAACGQVQPGYVGLKVNQYGSGSGVDPNVLGVGTYFTPMGTQIIEFPVYTQQYIYTASKNEGKAVNEEFTFNDKQGLNMGADIAVSYSVDSSKAPVLYQKFRSTAEGLVENQIRNEIRNDLNDIASAYAVDEIFGPKKKELLDKVQVEVAAHFKPYGLNIERLTWANTIRMPQSIHDQINQRIANEQQAKAAEANVITVEANARSAVAKAKGEADANALLAQSIKASPELVKLRAIEAWKETGGKMPTYVGAGAEIPIIGNLMKGN